MGSSESKPTYPTNEQWKEWSIKQDKYVKSKIDEIKNEKSNAINQEMVKGFKLFDNYMAHCQDVSGWKRLFHDNVDCTQARSELIQHMVKLSVGVAEDNRDLNDLKQLLRR